MQRFSLVPLRLVVRRRIVMSIVDALFASGRYRQMSCMPQRGYWAAVGFGVALLAVTSVRAAAAPAPGGVAGPTLWFAGSGYNGATWTDQSASGAVATQPVANSPYISPTATASCANFNPGVMFNGTSQELRGTTTTNLFAGANSYIFAVADSSVVAPSATNYGDVLSGNLITSHAGQGMDYYDGSFGVDGDGGHGDGPFTAAALTSLLSDVYYPSANTAVNATISENGITQTSTITNSVSSTNRFEIGARTAGTPDGTLGTNLFSGCIDEVIYYGNLGSPLTATQVSEIRSYLAIKYGITLGFNTQTPAVTPTDYFSSTGTKVWSSSLNTGYLNDVAGIGRDSASGLDQRVSHSINSVASGNLLDLTIANGSIPNGSTISTSQSANTALTDQTFVMWGDNGGSLTMSTLYGIYRMSRAWSLQITDSASATVTLQVPISALSGLSNPVLWVTAQANFQSGYTAVPMTCGTIYCTVHGTVPTGAKEYFSFGARTLSGTVFEDVNYGGGAGRSLATASGRSLSGVAVELYSAAGALVASTTTSAGTYSFNTDATATYTVRVVTPTMSTRTGGTTSGIMPVQTYRTDASGGTATAVTDHVGGETPTLVDAGTNGGSATLASLTTGAATPESITTAKGTTSTNISGIDFGYNFDTIVSTQDNATRGNPAQGTLGQFIFNANALTSAISQVGQPANQETSIFMISDGNAHPGLRAGLTNQLPSKIAVINLVANYPAITRPNVAIDGGTQTTNVGDTNTGMLGTGGTVGVDARPLSQVAAPEVEIDGGDSTTGNGYESIQATSTATGFILRNVALYTASPHFADIYATGAMIEKNVMGSKAGAFANTGIANAGIYLQPGSQGTLQNNLIGFAQANDVRVYNNSTWTIQNNEIRATSGPGPNIYSCIGWNSAGSSGNIAITGNLLTGCANQGISEYIGGGTLKTATDNTITSNGLGISGSAPALSGAIFLDGSGAGATVSKNIIANNYAAGIVVAATGSNWTLSQNSISNNGTISNIKGDPASGEIGIDLLTSAQSGTASPPYITPNKSGGTSSGGNSLLNFPVFDGAYITGSTLIVTGYARPGATLELFLADTSPASGFGQGLTYCTTLTEGGAPDLDGTTGTYNNPVTINNSGGNTLVGTDTTNRFRFSLPNPCGLIAGTSVLTATATLSAVGTSEFGPNILVGNSAGIPAIATVLSVSPAATLQAPGTVLTYTGVFTNTGAQAYSFSIVDPIPANTDFRVGSATTSLTNSNLTATAQYSTDANPNLPATTWTYSPPPAGGTGGAPAGYDRLVTGVKFVFSGSLNFNSPYNTGSFSLAVRIQ